MRQASRDRRRRQLWAAAEGRHGILTLEQARAAFDCGINGTRIILKELMVVGEDLPAISDYKPDFERTMAAFRYGKGRPLAPLGTVTAPEQENEPGEFMQADDEPIEAEIWPPRATMPKKAKFYRLR